MSELFIGGVIPIQKFGFGFILEKTCNYVENFHLSRIVDHLYNTPGSSES